MYMQKGFTFLEVAIGMILLALVAAFTTIYSRTAGGLNKKSGDLSQAAGLIQNEVEYYASYLAEPAHFQQFSAYVDADSVYFISAVKETLEHTEFSITNSFTRGRLGERFLRLRTQVNWLKKGTESDSQSISLQSYIQGRNE